MLFSLLAQQELFAQSGGRKKEGKAKSRGTFSLKRTKSKGHADEFAKGNSGRRGFLSRLFRKDKPAWTYRKSESPRKQYKANRYLFKRERAEGHMDNEETLKRQNKKRNKQRDRGNESFKRKKR